MGTTYEKRLPQHEAFIQEQHMFFVGTAFAITTIIFASYSLIYPDCKVTLPSPHYTQLFLACMLFFWGLSELKEKRKKHGILLLLVSLFNLLVFVWIVLSELKGYQ